MKRTHAKDRFEFFRARCHENGLRVTPQRIATYEELCQSGNHPSAEQIHSKLKRRFPTISLNTVNETLLTFSKVGLIEIVESFGSPRRYDPNIESHHHVHCPACRTIFDFSNDKFDRIKPPTEIAREFNIVRTKVVMTGICAKCRMKNEAKAKLKKQ